MNAAQPANVVLIANAVAPLFACAVALRAARNPVPGAVNTFGVQTYLGRGQAHFGKPVAMWLAVQRVIPDVGAAGAQALRPFAGDFRNQDLRVLVHCESQVGRRPPRPEGDNAMRVVLLNAISRRTK